MPFLNMWKRTKRLALCLALAVSSLACGDGDQVEPALEGVIDRETFVEVYVELRSAAVQTPELTLSDEVREEILARHDVDEESLIGFVEAYGRDLDYMNVLWAEVEGRIEALPPVPRR